MPSIGTWTGTWTGTRTGTRTGTPTVVAGRTRQYSNVFDFTVS